MATSESEQKTEQSLAVNLLSFIPLYSQLVATNRDSYVVKLNLATSSRKSCSKQFKLPPLFPLLLSSISHCYSCHTFAYILSNLCSLHFDGIVFWSTCHRGSITGCLLIQPEVVSCSNTSPAFKFNCVTVCNVVQTHFYKAPTLCVLVPNPHLATSLV